MWCHDVCGTYSTEYYRVVEWRCIQYCLCWIRTLVRHERWRYIMVAWVLSWCCNGCGGGVPVCFIIRIGPAFRMSCMITCHSSFSTHTPPNKSVIIQTMKSEIWSKRFSAYDMSYLVCRLLDSIMWLAVVDFNEEESIRSSNCRKNLISSVAAFIFRKLACPELTVNDEQITRLCLH